MKINLILSISAFGLLIHNGTNSFAQETIVAIQPIVTSSTHFNASLMVDQDLKPISQFLRHQPLDHIEALKADFLTAQKAFLESEIKMIQDQWLKVTQWAFKSDWNDEYRELIHTAYLRLAQSSSNAAESDQWLRIAIQYDDRFQPSTNLYPPPLITRYNQLKKTIPRTLLNLASIKNISLILINGREYAVSKVTRYNIPTAEARVAYLSNSLAPQTRTMSTGDISNYSAKQTYMVAGDCANPKIQNEALLSLKSRQLALVFPNNCIRMIKNGLLLENNSTKNDSLAGKDINTREYDHLNTESAYLATQSQWDSRLAQSKPFYKKPLFWVGASVVVSAIILSQKDKGSENPSVPTHTEGF